MWIEHAVLILTRHGIEAATVRETASIVSNTAGIGRIQKNPPCIGFRQLHSRSRYRSIQSKINRKIYTKTFTEILRTFMFIRDNCAYKADQIVVNSGLWKSFGEEVGQLVIRLGQDTVQSMMVWLISNHRDGNLVRSESHSR
ncbi:hypothetical protein Tco_1556747 [Tanacetum coccineum]